MEGTIEAVGNSRIYQDGTLYSTVKIGDKIIENLVVAGNSSLFFHVGNSGKYFIVEKAGKGSVLYGIVKDGKVLSDERSKMKSKVSVVIWLKLIFVTCLASFPMMFFVALSKPLMIAITLIVWAFVVYLIRKGVSDMQKSMNSLPVKG